MNPLYQRKKCCCGGTCLLCGLYTCPPLSGITVTLSGVHVRTVAEQMAIFGEGYYYRFDQTTLSGSFCCYAVGSGADGCELSFASDPVLTGQLQTGGVDNPDEPPVSFGIGVTYNCATGKIDILIGGNIRPTLEANVRESFPENGVVYTTIFDGDYTGPNFTSVDWPVGCVRVGFSGDNAIPDSRDQVDHDTTGVYGNSGSASIDSAC